MTAAAQATGSIDRKYFDLTDVKVLRRVILVKVGDDDAAVRLGDCGCDDIERPRILRFAPATVRRVATLSMVRRSLIFWSDAYRGWKVAVGESKS